MVSTVKPFCPGLFLLLLKAFQLLIDSVTLFVISLVRFSISVIFVILGIWSFRLDYLICWSYYYIFISIRLVVVALLLFLILIIWAFSFFLFCLRKKSCQVCYFFKEPAFGFIDFSLFLYSTFCLSLLH